MTIQEAINKAVKSGWDCGKLRSFDGVECLDEAEVCLDPSFWQALGKSLGWVAVCNGCGVNNAKECKCDDGYSKLPEIVDEWLYHWHSLIDHLAEGKSPEDYFKNL